MAKNNELEEQFTGKVISSINEEDDYVAITFSDGSILVFESDGYEGNRLMIQTKYIKESVRRAGE